MARMTTDGVWDTNNFQELLGRVEGDLFWRPYLDTLAASCCRPFSLHLAVLLEPYLDFILTGKKTVESRFSLKRCPPYRRVSPGDVLLLKRASGPVLGISRVADVLFYELDRDRLKSIRKTHADAICPASGDFWREREGASFATLIWLEKVKAIDPLSVKKRDRRGWVILTERSQQTPFGAVC
jgi:ASC-1-like (ASCH) protein